ncbi:MAG TPA: cupin domain-containing protein [Alphaproteobacteria bacterium]|nr:cupin domain-containing protein [Alphaproteobacteria bacterium]
MAETMATIQRKAGDNAMEAVHESEREWETLRFPGQSSKMLFHPQPERPTEPNAGFVRYEPGAHHPLHRHDFAQIWYILEGTFTIGGKTYRPGTMIFHADPHYEEELRTESGGVMLFVQYQGPSTGGRPVYDGRFNVAARKPLSEERLDV